MTDPLGPLVISQDKGLRTALAVIGYGRWGPNHVRTLGSMAEVDLRVICDASAEARERASQASVKARVVGWLDDILGDAAIEGVIVATPAETHADLALPLLRAGKHVLIEKPLAPNLADATRIIDCARAHSALVHVGHICAFQAGARRGMQLIQEGEIGVLQALDTQRTSTPPLDPQVDVIWDLAVHDLSILDLWTGRSPLRVMATGCRRHSDGLLASATAVLWYPGNLVATVRVSWMDHRKLRQVVAVGTQATLIFDDLDHDEPLRRQSTSGQVAIPTEHGAPLQRELKAFVAAIRTGDPRPLEQQSGLRILEVLTAMQQSARQGGQVITLNAPSA